MAVLQPLPQPPLRHSKSLQIAPEAQPAALLLVDVLTASNVASVEAPKAGQQQTADVQETQQVICALAFEDTLNKSHTGNHGGHVRHPLCVESWGRNEAHVDSLSLLRKALGKVRNQSSAHGQCPHGKKNIQSETSTLGMTLLEHWDCPMGCRE